MRSDDSVKYLQLTRGASLTGAHERTRCASKIELLGLLLQLGTKDAGAKKQAKTLLETFGSLASILAADPHCLLAKISSRRAVQLLQVVGLVARRALLEEFEAGRSISSSVELENYLKLTLSHEKVEVVKVIYLNQKNKLIKDEILFRGSVSHCQFYPRELIRRVIELNASSIIIAHNHPSGEPQPSAADIAITRDVQAAVATIGVRLHDHVIVGAGKCFSLACSGLLRSQRN